MAGVQTNWDSTETWQRVVAAIIASGVKLDLRAVAKLYGTTYDTLENRFRKIKKLAAELKTEIDNGERGEVVAARKSNPSTPRKPKTPKKEALNSVANGRVTKATPTKKKSIKQEQLESAGSSFFDEMTDDNMGSFTTSGMDSFDAETGGMFGVGMDFEN